VLGVVEQGQLGEGPNTAEELDAQRARLVAEMLEEQQRVLNQQVGGGQQLQGVAMYLGSGLSCSDHQPYRTCTTCVVWLS
jgi:hypothetical protein